MGPNRKPATWAATLAISVSLILAALCLLAEAQSSAVKGPSSAVSKQNRPRPASSTYAPNVVQQQQVRQSSTGTKSKPATQQQRVDSDYNEDPLADSEPALYGSVAGAPGVDFPAYTRIPKTSFTCEGKGHDFGFYADQEAQCQVYHVCWSGRHEAFLCGVGTVFNQAILACDYWHSVDCSKSSQFYGVNSELGKAGAEPSNNQQQQQQQQQARNKQNAPSSSSSALASSQFGGPVSKQRRLQEDSSPSPVYQSSKQRPANKQQQQQPPVQQVQVNQNTFEGYSQQRLIQPPSSQRVDSAKMARPQAIAQVQIQMQEAPPAAPVAATKRARFNPDFNQKVNSLIEAPVRAPLKSTGTSTASQRPAPGKRSQPGKQSPWTARKPVRPAAPVQQVPQISQQQEQHQEQVQQLQEPLNLPTQQPVQQQRNYEPEPEEAPQQQQQQTFDDSPVQTSTAQNNYLDRLMPVNKAEPQQQQQEIEQVQQQQQAFANDGSSSAITSQYDTLAGDAYGDSSAAAAAAADEANNDDFRSAGAKAAASNNQNWYIMRTV